MEKDTSDKPTREDQTEGQHRINEPELFMRKETEAENENSIRFSDSRSQDYPYDHLNVQTFLPVNHKCPENSCQQNFISLKGKEAPMKKERKMRADDNRKPLSKVPMPGVRAVEICHAVEDVKLQKVELNQGPLKTNKQSRDSYILTSSS